MGKREDNKYVPNTQSEHAWLRGGYNLQLHSSPVTQQSLVPVHRIRSISGRGVLARRLQIYTFAVPIPSRGL